MELSTLREGAVAVVAVAGDVDRDSVEALRQWLDELFASGERYFVIDLSGVGLMDGSGLATLVQLFKRARMGHGDVRLCCLPPALERSFELSRLDRVFDVFDQCDEAISSYDGDARS
jgi:anti-sigma B factor antagonist